MNRTSTRSNSSTATYGSFTRQQQQQQQQRKAQSVARMSNIDLLEELLEYLEEFALRSDIIANIVDSLDSSSFDRVENGSSHNNSNSHHGHRPIPAAKSEIFRMKHASVNRSDRIKHEHDDSLCSICYERLLDGISLTQMPCQHVYHSDCLVRWLQSHNTCPQCRYEIKTNDPTIERQRRKHSHGNREACQQDGQNISPKQQSSLCAEKFAQTIIIVP